MLQEENLELVPDLMKFMCEVKVLPKSLTNESTAMNVSPTVWWKRAEKLNHTKSLILSVSQETNGHSCKFCFQ